MVTAAVMGLVPHDVLVRSGSPFVDATAAIFPGHAWAGSVIAAVAVVSGIGALNGWTLIVTEASRPMAEDGLFPRPFAWNDRHGNAWFGIVVGAALPSLLMLWRFTSSTGLTVFTYLVGLSAVTVAIPYLVSALAQLVYVVSHRRRVDGWRFGRDCAISVACVAFSSWMTVAAGYQILSQALAVVVFGLVGWAVSKTGSTRPRAQEPRRGHRP